MTKDKNKAPRLQHTGARRDKVIVTKVTAEEFAEINDTAEQCGMTRSDFARARMLGYKPAKRLTKEEDEGLRQLAASRTDMVNFNNAMQGLTEKDKVRLFHSYPFLLEWYENVATVTNAVLDYLRAVRLRNWFPPRTTSKAREEVDA